MTVVHCKVSNYTHYIGRPSPLANQWSHRSSKFTNVIPMASAMEAVQAFYDHASRDDEKLLLIESLPNDAILGCWCHHPSPCHGYAIIRIWRELRGLTVPAIWYRWCAELDG